MDQYIKEIEPEIRKISEVAGFLWNKGWSERNAGNISFDFTGITNPSSEILSAKRHHQVELPAESAGMILFVTGTGERLRDLVHAAENVSCVLRIDDDAKGYQILWGGNNPDFRPTSEFKSHLSIHLFNRRRGSRHRCVVHSHPVELIAFSHHPFFGHEEEAINQALWSMLPEVRVYVPRGIALIPYEMPGSHALADLTIKGLGNRDVILWSKHGALATGQDALQAFDFLDVVNKAATIYLKCLQAGFRPEGLTEQQMKDLDVNI